MNEKKGTRPDVAASERAKMEAGTEQATTSIFNHTTMIPPGQAGIISQLLSRGADHGLHLSDLVRLTDLSERDVRRQIEIERRSGALIISDNRNGYYLTDDPGEAKRFARSMRHRADQIKQTATAIEQAIGRAKEAAGI